MRTWIVLTALPTLLWAQTAGKQAKKSYEDAIAAVRSGNAEEAARSYRKAIEADPAFAEAWCGLGRLQAKSAQYAEARTSFEQAIRLDPDYLEPYAPLALLLNAAKDWEALANSTDRQLEIEPYGPALGWLLNATAHYHLRNFAAAEKGALAAQELDTRLEYPRIPYLLGNILIARGDSAGAAVALKRFLERAPADPEAPNVRRTIARLEEASAANSPAATGATFQVSANLALVSFTVEPKTGALTTDLRPEDIDVREDGAPQKIAFFEGGKLFPRQLPVEVTLLFDASGSVRQTEALDPFALQKSLLAEYDNVSLAIYGFSDNLTRFSAPTRDMRKLRQAMAAVAGIAPSGTPLFGYIAETVRQAASTGRSAIRMLVVFSDAISGADGDSARVAEAIREARNRGVAVYPVALVQNVPSAAPASRMALDAKSAAASTRSRADFLSLAEATGGKPFTELSNAEALERVLSAIARRVQYNYVVGYYPSTGDTGARHKVDVRWAGKPRGEIIAGARVTSH
jgi:VWFA-related protein